MSNHPLGFIFHADRCIQCHGCELACKMWRKTERGVLWRRVVNIWWGEFPQVTCSSVSVSCLHCSDPACAAACPSQAIFKRDSDGIVLVNARQCTGCGMCSEACPFGVPQFGADGLMQKCDMCAPLHTGVSEPYIPPCVRTCPTRALEVAELTTAQKAETEKELLSTLNNRYGR